MNWELDLGMKKMARYAAYQDRSRKELVQKLRDIGCPEDKQEELLEELKRLGFWDEERFARSYTRGKFRQKGWGRIKIRQGLWSKGIDGELADMAIDEEIDPKAYRQLLEKEVAKRLRSTEGELTYEAKQKLARQLMQRGFESELIFGLIAEMRGQ